LKLYLVWRYFPTDDPGYPATTEGVFIHRKNAEEEVVRLKPLFSRETIIEISETVTGDELHEPGDLGT
jgi:hypothetical protein